jgi:hypothetical protein
MGIFTVSETAELVEPSHYDMPGVDLCGAGVDSAQARLWGLDGSGVRLALGQHAVGSRREVWA